MDAKKVDQMARTDPCIVVYARNPAHVRPQLQRTQPMDPSALDDHSREHIPWNEGVGT